MIPFKESFLFYNRKMDKIVKKYEIRKNNHLFNLEDIVKKIVESKSPATYINKIQDKQRINSHYFVTKIKFIELLSKSKSKKCKEALKMIQDGQEIDKPVGTSNQVALMDNKLTFEGTGFYYFKGDNDSIWFKGKDIASILGYKDKDQSIREHVDDYDKLPFKDLKKFSNMKYKDSTMFINKNGVSSLCIKSRKPKSIELAKMLNIDVNQKYPCKESEVLNNIIYYLDEKEIKYELQKEVKGYKMDMYLPNYNINIEIDEFGHKDRCDIYEVKREKVISKKLKCDIIRFDPDNKDDNIFKFIARLEKLINNIIKSRNEFFFKLDESSQKKKLSNELELEKLRLQIKSKELEIEIEQRKKELKERELNMILELVGDKIELYQDSIIKWIKK